MLSSSLLTSQFTDPAIAAILSDSDPDGQYIARLLEVEAALAKAEANAGVIPAQAAQDIATSAATLQVNFERLRSETERDGFPITELVRQLRERVGGESADHVHWGATTQDILDTAFVLQIRAVLDHLESKLNQLILNLLIQEHERATHGWQLEWLSLPQMLTLTAAALNKAIFLSEHLVVNEARMRENVRASNGLMLAESLSFALAPHVGRAEANKLVKAACQIASNENRHLVDVVREWVNTRIEFDWNALKDESAYLGAAQELIDRVIHVSTNKRMNE